MFEPLRCENQRSTVSHTESSRQHHDVHHRVSVLRNSLSDGSPWSPEHRVPLAYARIIPPGIKYAEPSIGRVITTSAARGSGLGRELVKRSIAQCQELFPGQGIRISAQSRLERFYESFGFTVQGEQYMEDDIPHTEMLLPAKPTQ